MMRYSEEMLSSTIRALLGTQFFKWFFIFEYSLFLFVNVYGLLDFFWLCNFCLDIDTLCCYPSRQLDCRSVATALR